MIVFIPFAFTRTCEGELCQLRDEFSVFDVAEAVVVAITSNTLHANRAWSEQQGFEFDILSDFWPHGDVAKAYGVFNDVAGMANRGTFLIDKDGIVRDRIEGAISVSELEEAMNKILPG